MKIGKILGALASVVLTVVSLAPVASADTVLAAPNCQHGSTYGVAVVDPAPIGSYGTIQLCRDSSYNYWAFVLFNKPLTASQWGEAALEIYRDGFYQGDAECSDIASGGNDYVKPGERRCWTPKHVGVSGRYTYVAEGHLTSSSSGLIDWNRTDSGR